MTYRLQLSETFVMSEQDLSYGKNRTFFHKNKNAVQWGFLLCCPHPSSLKKKRETLVLNQGSRCLYVFIYFDIYSVCCQAICLPGCIPEILKTYMAKPQRSKTCVLGTLCSTLGLSLRRFLWKEPQKSSYCPGHILRNVLDGDQAPGEESIQGGVLPLLSEGPLLETSLQRTAFHRSLGHLLPLLFSHFIIGLSVISSFKT